MNKEIKISIITVCYNSVKTIRTTVESLLSQTYSNFEHIFVDGGSTDGTIELIRSYKNQYDKRLILHVGKDNGIYDAMNIGIGLATGEIIGIINSDDWYECTALEDVALTYKKAKSRNIIITGDIIRTKFTGEKIYLQRHNMNCVTLDKLIDGMPLQHPAVFVASSVYEKIGKFDISYKYLADYDFIWRCFASKIVDFEFTHTVTSYMREGGVSDTFRFRNIKERTQERYRLRKQYIGKYKAALTSGKFFVMEILKQSLKRILPQSIKNKYYIIKHNAKK